MSKTLNRLLANPRVESVSDESSGGDGYWVYLNHGWQRGNFPGTPSTPGGGNSNLHIVHEWTMREVLTAIRNEVSPCDCWECRKALGKPELLA